MDKSRDCAYEIRWVFDGIIDVLAAEGRLEEAYELSASTSTLPEICGRICPQDRLCERNCVIEQSGHGTVTIGAVEKYINDTAWEQGWVKPLVARRQRRESARRSRPSLACRFRHQPP